MRHLALTIYGTGYCANRRDKRKLDDVRIMKAVREILEAIEKTVLSVVYPLPSYGHRNHRSNEWQEIYCFKQSRVSRLLNHGQRDW
jgi:hypothetical protein